MPLIIVITINLNNLSGLKKTVQSVLDQYFKDYEYIVIDGGSKDGSKDYLKEKNEDIDYWISENDKGIYDAMNKGIKIAKGKYLYFLNSGDWLCNSSVFSEVQKQLIDSDFVYGDLIKSFPNGDLKLDKGVAGKQINFQTFITGTINHGACFINRKMFQKYGLYDDTLKIVSDWKFFLIALGLNNAHVKYIDMPVAYFDMTGMSNNLILRGKEREKVVEEVVPKPIYRTYIEFIEKQKKFTSYRYRKFEITDNKRFSRKLHSIIFRLFS